MIGLRAAPADCVSGQRPDFETVFRLFQPLLVRQARLFHDPRYPYPGVDDLFQVASLGLWTAYRRCTRWNTFPAFARKVVRDDLAEHVAVTRSHMPTVSLDALNKDDTRWTFATPLGLTASDDGEQALRLDVRRALAQLPVAQARNLWAVRGLGWKAAEWARHNGQHRNTVHQSLRRAHRRLKETPWARN